MEAIFGHEGLRLIVASYLNALNRLRLFEMLGKKDKEEPLTIQGHELTPMQQYCSMLENGHLSLYERHINISKIRKYLKVFSKEVLALKNKDIPFILEITPKTKSLWISRLNCGNDIANDTSGPIVYDKEKHRPNSRKIIIKCKQCNKYHNIMIAKWDIHNIIKTYAYSIIPRGIMTHVLCKCQIPDGCNYQKHFIFFDSVKHLLLLQSFD